jgi:hypothetical protein
MLPPFVYASAIALSTLAVMPVAPAANDKGPQPAFVKVEATQGWATMTVPAGLGYCIVPAQWGMRIGDSMSSSVEGNQSAYVLRLVEKDGKVTLEKTRFAFEPKTSTMHAGTRVSIALGEVASAGGVKVWGYRDGPNVILLARGVDGGFDTIHPDPENMNPPFIGSDGCPYAIGHLDLDAAKSGAMLQFSGALPTRGKGKDAVTPRFLVDASLAKLSRDPEPMLSVRVRLKE